MAREAARNGGFRLEAIDHLIFTQVRSKTIDGIMEDPGLPGNPCQIAWSEWR